MKGFHQMWLKYKIKWQEDIAVSRYVELAIKPGIKHYINARTTHYINHVFFSSKIIPTLWAHILKPFLANSVLCCHGICGSMNWL